MMNKNVVWFVLCALIVMVFNVNFVLAEDKQDPDQVEFKLRKEEVVFIPYRQLNKVLSKNKDLVYMSYKELKELIEEKSTIRPLAPVNHVIKDLALSGNVHKEFVTFEANYKIEILNNEWVYIPVLSKMVALKSAEFDGKPAPISTYGSNFRILSDKLGEHTLKLKFDVKVDESGNNKSFRFGLPNLPIARLAVSVPEVPNKLNITGSSGMRSEVKKGKTITYVNLKDVSTVDVNWRSNLIETAKPKPVVTTVKESKLPSKVKAKVETLISIDDGIMQGYSTYTCQIHHKPVEKLTFHIPDDVEIVSVTSPGNIIRKGPPIVTDPNGKEPGKVLTVFFNSKIRDNAVFNILFEKTFDNKRVEESIPTIYLTGKEINKIDGFIAIQSLGNIEIRDKEQVNVTPSPQIPGNLESMAQNPILKSYQYIITRVSKDKALKSSDKTKMKGIYKLVLEIIPSKDASVVVAMIDSVNIISNLASNGNLTTKADYLVRNMSEHSFKFVLPKGAEPPQAEINGRQVKVEITDICSQKNCDDKEKAQQSKEQPEYRINIKKHQDEKPFRITVMYKQQMSAFNLIATLFTLKAPEVQDIPVMTVKWSLWVPHDMRYWFNTALNKGSSNYAAQIRMNEHTTVTDVNNMINTQSASGASSELNIPVQVYNVAPGDYGDVDRSGTATLGGMPAKLDMPSTKGLISFNYSDYLIQQDELQISIIGLNGIFKYLIFLLMIIAGWKIAVKSYQKIEEDQTSSARAKFFIPLVVVLYIIGKLLGSGLVWVPIVLAVVAFIVYKNLNKMKKVKE